MELFRRGLCRPILVAGLLVFAQASSLVAVTAPSKPDKRTLDARMVDARVNLPEARKSAIDARGSAATAGRAEARTQTASILNAIVSFRQTMPGLSVKLAGNTGAPSSVSNKRGALTPFGGSPEGVARDFMLQNGALYGLTASDVSDLVVLGESSGSSDVLPFLRMEQQIDGRQVFQSETRFSFDREGRLVKTVGQMVPRARLFAPQVDPSQLLTPGAAVSRLLASVGKAADPSAFAPTGNVAGPWTELAGNNAFVLGPVSAREVLFPLTPGLLVPAWSLVVFTAGDADYYAVVDAQTGDLLWRKNIRNYASTHDARFRVYVQGDGITPAESPAPGSPNNFVVGSNTQPTEIAPTTNVSMHAAMIAASSPNGWIDDCPGGVCTANETQTLGNNVLACMDRAAPANVCDTDAGGVLDGNGRPTGNPDPNGRNRDFLGTAPRDFQTGYLPPPQGGNPEAGQTATGAGASGTNAFDQFRRGSVTQQFYVGNWYHDRLFSYGFDEAAANFQQTNFSAMGLGGDRVLIDVQDASGTNNANFGTPPDGISGRAQMFRFTSPTIDRDGGLDTVILIHELTHGTSNRLVGNAAGLNWDIAGSMGEGWSDFYALAMLNPTNTDDQYPAGAYATYKLGGLLDNYIYAIRRFPYSTDNTINPMTWADVDDVTNNLAGGIAPDPLGFNFNGAMEVHNAGELWALSLFEARSRIIADPLGANGNVATGNDTTLRIVTQGLKMTPIDPSFLDARDALFDADCALFACANEMSIWGGFADRGLGYKAGEPYFASIALIASHLGIQESFQSPYLDVVNPATDITVNDAASNNNGTLDTNETAQLSFTVTNPWRGATKAVTAGGTCTLTTTTPGVTIYSPNTCTLGAIAPQGTGTCGNFVVTVGSPVVCGNAIDFTLTCTTNLGTTAAPFRMRVGDANGTDPLVTYTATPNQAIPDDDPRGVVSTLNITDDFEIADLNYRLNSVTHTFVDDLTIMLRAPGGIGIDMVSLIGLNGDGGGADNLSNFLVDDDLPFTLAEDMIAALAPTYNNPGDWIPVYNSPTFADPFFFGVAPDPTGNLTHFNGLSTLGNWSTLSSDQFIGDLGTLNAWSLLVTPVHFDCVAGTLAANVTGTKTVSGTFTPGGTVTYTVVLTNNGTGNQGDNAGDEFTDILPAGLTLVSAVATSGTPGTAGNTVTWNGSLSPLGGTVTITITATVNAGTECDVISNQGTINYDSNNDNTNDATNLTDGDPGTAGDNPTTFTVPGNCVVAISGTKTASGGPFVVGGTVTYTIVLTNSGGSDQLDNPGDEFTDPVPACMTNVAANDGANPGTIGVVGNTVTWNGGIPAGGSVTITITATIGATCTGTINNQGTFNYDADANGTNESSGTTDDPVAVGANNPTPITIVGAPEPIPTVSEWGMLALGLGLLLAAWTQLRRRRMTA